MKENEFLNNCKLKENKTCAGNSGCMFSKKRETVGGAVCKAQTQYYVSIASRFHFFYCELFMNLVFFSVL